VVCNKVWTVLACNTLRITGSERVGWDVVKHHDSTNQS